MADHLHIIITGEKGDTFKLPCTRKKVRVIVISSVVLLFILTTASLFSLTLFSKNRHYSSQLAELREQLRTSAELIAEQRRQNKEEKLALNLRVANLELDNSRQAQEFKAEKEGLISSAINELNERSELIEQIMGSIGIELSKDTPEDNKNSGGPYIRDVEGNQDELLYRADKYLTAIKNLPFGRPVMASISSRFGKRIDPVNGKAGYHTGIDFRADRGDKVHATADGIVKKAFKNGGYGNFVLLDHGNGYTTSFAHLDRILVKKGERVERGQVIGLVGNTGRSTGSHLHYEICLDKKPINPYQFMKVASLGDTKTSSKKN